MLLISPDYRDQQRQMHAARTYGDSGGKWAATVWRAALANDCRSVLDYGCGTGAMVRNLRKLGYPSDVREYDPGVPGKDAEPKPADLVTCLDVLEHVEYLYIGRVIEHLLSLTFKKLFVVISTRPAGKLLPDGRNAHLIIETEKWWRSRLLEHGFVVEKEMSVVTNEFTALCRPF